MIAHIVPTKIVSNQNQDVGRLLTFTNARQQKAASDQDEGRCQPRQGVKHKSNGLMIPTSIFNPESSPTKGKRPCRATRARPGTDRRPSHPLRRMPCKRVVSALRLLQPVLLGCNNPC